MSRLHLRRCAIAVATTAAGATALSLVAAPATSAATNAAGPGGHVRAGSADADRQQLAAARHARQAERSLGADGAGVWKNAAGQMVVATTDTADVRRLRSSGATVRLVDHSTAALGSVVDKLSDKISTPGTSFGVDPADNQVEVSIDATVPAAQAARVERIADRWDAKTTVRDVAGELAPLVSGGQAIWAQGGGRCSLGFNVTNGSTDYFLTAGHCTDVAANWYADSGQTQLLGSGGTGSFPGDDYGIVTYPGAGGAGNVDLYNGSFQDITAAGNAVVGQTVTRSGSTTGTDTGQVTAQNATVNYAEGTVYGLIQTNLCAEPGDSGGSLIAGSTALGLTSGGSGNCIIGGQTFFQPVTEALNAYGVSVY